MDPLVVGVIGIAILIVLLFSGLPIGAGMALVGVVGFGYLVGYEPALGLLKTVPYSTFADESLSVVPLFILMGYFAFNSGLGQDIFQTIYTWVGHFRGGIAQAVIIACAAFAAISGSSLATAATLGSVALPEMRKFKYDDGLATGAVAAGGSIGILIPPSIVLIIYGIITEQSIGKLFLAGFIPGVLEAVFYLFTIYYLTLINPSHGPKGPKTTMKQKFVSLKDTWEFFLLFIVVIGGIYIGVFTPTEAAGVGAFGAFLFPLIRRRMTYSTFMDSLRQTCSTSGMIFMIILGAMLFGYFLSVSRVPTELATMVADLPVNRYVILALILVVILVLGCIMDSMAIVLLTVPVFYPVVMQLGFNPIWFGIIVVRCTEMGLITPPVGMNVYIIKGISGVPIEKIFKGTFPHLIADFLEVIFLIAFPQVIMFLPNMMS